MFYTQTGKSSKIKLPDGFIRISDENHLKIRGHDKLVGLNNWIYPPCKITDLRVFQVDTDEDGKTFAIKWTAVGAYLDRGNGRRESLKLYSFFCLQTLQLYLLILLFFHSHEYFICYVRGFTIVMGSISLFLIYT